MTETASNAAPAAKPNGHSQGQVVQVEPAQVAAMTLEFLARTTLTPPERQRYGICEQFLVAIQSGQLQVSGPVKPTPPEGSVG